MIYTTDGTTKTNLPAVFRWNQQWYGHFFRVAFKPVATIMQKQESLDNQGTLRK
jgi:chorismate synthase